MRIALIADHNDCQSRTHRSVFKATAAHLIAFLALSVGFACNVGAQGANGRPRPFEAGYFPGYEQPHVVATTAHLEISTDDRSLPVAFPVDAQLVRIVMVKNVSSSKVRAALTQSITITPLIPELFFIHPQPGMLYLEPGETYPVRIQYLIPSDSRAPAWSPGDHINVPMTLTIQEQSVSTGLDVGSAVTVTLPHDITVVRPVNATAFDPDPAPNATISGTVRHADTLLPYANTGLLVEGATGSQHIQTDATGHYTAQIYAYKRSGGEPDWREFSLWMDNAEHLRDGLPILIPKAGETTSFDYLAPPARTMASYTNTGSLQLGLSAYAWHASVDGSVIATVPFHSGLAADVIASRSFVNVFTSEGTSLWRYPLNGETPAIDVSDDGQYIATTRRPDSQIGKPLVTGGEAIVLNRAGQLLRTFPMVTRSMSPWGPEDRQPFYTEARFSHDNKYLALGDGEGWLSLVDMATGQELWHTFLKGQVRRIDFDTNDARLFASAGDGYLRAFDLSGNQLWKTWVDSWIAGNDISAHYILASSKAARQGLHLINKVTGTTVWSYQVETLGHVGISPDESYVSYGTFGGGGFWLPGNAIFSIDGMPVWQLGRADQSAADAGTVSASGDLIAFSRGCTVNVSDRSGRPVFRSPVLGGFNDADCAGQYNFMMWMSSDGKRMVSALGPRDMSTVGGSVYFFNADAAVPVFTAHPASQSVGVGTSVSFTAVADSTPSASYQWQVSMDGGVVWTNLIDIAPHSGTRTASLTVASATAAMGGRQYRLMATNSVVWAFSHVATLAVYGADTVTVSPGWNLIGNSVASPMTVASSFGNASQVASVWKWVSTGTTPGMAYPTWAFYSPSQSDGGQAYANSKGYEFLSSINTGEGFWINARTSFNFSLPNASAVASTAFQNVSSGWHLISTGDSKTPAALNTDVATTTLWAWDSAQSKWYFYAPSLQAQGGTALSDYIKTNGYLDFASASKTLGPGTGFWIYKP